MGAIRGQDGQAIVFDIEELINCRSIGWLLEVICQGLQKERDGRVVVVVV